MKKSTLPIGNLHAAGRLNKNMADSVVFASPLSTLNDKQSTLYSTYMVNVSLSVLTKLATEITIS